MSGSVAGETGERNERGFVTMVDPSTEGHRSLRDVLRAIELDEQHHMPLPIANNTSDEQKRALAPLTPSVVSRLGDVADAEAPDDWDEIESDRVSVWWSNRIGFSMFAVAAVGASFIAPVAIMVLAGSIVIAPSPNGAWAVASLDEIKFDRSSPASATDKQAEIRQAGFVRIQGFAGLWQSLTSDAPPPRLSTKLTIEASPGETVALPIHIESAEPLPTSASLVVRGVPEFASLSAAEPQSDGSWRVPIPGARDVKLTAYAQPARDQELTIELQDSDGEIVSRASTLFKAGSDAPVVAAIEPVQTTVPVAPIPKAKSQLNSANAGAAPVAVESVAKVSPTPSKAASEIPAPVVRDAKPKRTASAPMRAGLTSVQPQPRPAPKTPRIVIVDGPLPAAATAPMVSYAPPSSPPPSAPAAVSQPSIHDTNNSWTEPWARDAFRTHK